jgi:Tfp pilus assembly protein PilZ
MLASTAEVQEPVMNAADSRRHHEQHAIVLPATVEHAGRILEGTSRNLSLGGMFLNVDGPVPLGARIQLSFSIPTQSRPIVAAARVRWTDGKTGIGVQFDGLRPRDVFALQQLLASRPSRP